MALQELLLLQLVVAMCSASVSESVVSRSLSALVTIPPTSYPWNYQIVDGVQPDAALTATFSNSIEENGWSFLEIHDTRDQRHQSLPKPGDDMIAFLAGVMEANLTAHLMEQHWQNTESDFACGGDRELCTDVLRFLYRNNFYVGRDKDLSDARWYQSNLYTLQWTGLLNGYLSLKRKILPDIAFVYFQLHGDFDDIVAAVNSSSHSYSTRMPRVPGSGSCSALIKVLPDSSDLLIGHNTWTSYFNMMRIFKLYDFKFQRSRADSTVIPGHAQAFPSYPGRLYSGDDFYLLSSGMVTMETSIENVNPDLWKYVTPSCILKNTRVVIANRLANTAKEWTDIFRMYNSGTYNNQWMILDHKQFVIGQPLKDGLLWILEQMPGHVEARDETEVLRTQSYWASYNIPYYKSIFDISGTAGLAEKYGDWFTWDKNPRAKIFARDHGDVTDLSSLSKIMKYNDFKHDELSLCNCTPPYSAENAIAARSDLNPADGAYPFSALGHRLHGAIDSKMTSVLTLQHDPLSCNASSGPTWTQQPPFQWSTSGNPNGVPGGHPDKWDFNDVQVQWKL